MSINPVKILSIEDDEFMKIFIKDVFWLHGAKERYLLKLTDNLKKGWEIIQNPETRPDLVLLDLNLPKIEGGELDKNNSFEFLEKIKSSPETKNIKVLIFSGYSDNELKEKALKSGADDFLVKSEQLPKELIAAVKKTLNL